MDDPALQLVEIYRALNLPQAHALRMVLEGEGVPVLIDGEMLQGAVGDLPLGWVTSPRLLVQESQADAAREILRREEQRDRELEEEDGPGDAPRCMECGEE